MTNDRPYRKARSVSAAVREIVSHSGTQFSPKIVEALARLHERGKLWAAHNETDDLATVA